MCRLVAILAAFFAAAATTAGAAHADLSTEEQLLEELEGAARSANVTEGEVRTCAAELARAQERLARARATIAAALKQVSASDEELKGTLGDRSKVWQRLEQTKQNLQSQTMRVKQLEATVSELRTKLQRDAVAINATRTKLQEQAKEVEMRLKAHRAKVDDALATKEALERMSRDPGLDKWKQAQRMVRVKKKLEVYKRTGAAMTKEDEDVKLQLKRLNAQEQGWAKSKQILRGILQDLAGSKEELRSRLRTYGGEKQELKSLDTNIDKKSREHTDAEAALRLARGDLGELVKVVMKKQGDQIRLLREHHEGEMESERSRQAREREALKRDTKMRVDDLASQHDKELDIMKTQHAEELEALRAQHAAEHEKLKAQQADIVSEKDHHIEDLKQATVERIETLRTEQEAQLKAFGEEQEFDREALNSEEQRFNEMRAAQEQSVREMSDAHDTELAAARDRHSAQLKAMDDDRQRQMEALHSEHTDQLDRLQASHEAQLESQQAQHRQEMQDLKEMQNKHVRELEEEILSREDTIRQRHGQIEDLIKVQGTALKEQKRAQAEGAALSGRRLKGVMEHNEKALAEREREMQRLVEAQKSEVEFRDREVEELQNLINGYDAQKTGSEHDHAEHAHQEHEAVNEALARAQEAEKRASAQMAEAITSSHDGAKCGCLGHKPLQNPAPEVAVRPPVAPFPPPPQQVPLPLPPQPGPGPPPQPGSQPDPMQPPADGLAPPGPPYGQALPGWPMTFPPTPRRRQPLAHAPPTRGGWITPPTPPPGFAAPPRLSVAEAPAAAAPLLEEAEMAEASRDAQHESQETQHHQEMEEAAADEAALLPEPRPIRQVAAVEEPQAAADEASPMPQPRSAQQMATVEEPQDEDDRVPLPDLTAALRGFSRGAHAPGPMRALRDALGSPQEKIRQMAQVLPSPRAPAFRDKLQALGDRRKAKSEGRFMDALRTLSSSRADAPRQAVSLHDASDTLPTVAHEAAEPRNNRFRRKLRAIREEQRTKAQPKPMPHIQRALRSVGASKDLWKAMRHVGDSLDHLGALPAVDG